MPTLGTDCDILLIHPAVNGGNPYGFLLDHRKSEGPTISIQREAELQTDGTYQDTFRFFFTILIRDGAQQPDGGVSSMMASDYYTMLLDYLRQHSGIAITTPRGVYSNLYTIEHYCTETQLESAILVAVQLSSTDMAFFPANFDSYVLSTWTLDAYAGAMNWGKSYWRTS